MEKTHQPLVKLLVDFCQYFTGRDIKNLMSLFSKNPICISFITDHESGELDLFEQRVKKLWAGCEESTLTYCGPTFFFNSPLNTALGFLTLKTKEANNLYLYSYLKCDIICIKENENWRINDLRILPVQMSKSRGIIRKKNLSLSS